MVVTHDQIKPHTIIPRPEGISCFPIPSVQLAGQPLNANGGTDIMRPRYPDRYDALASVERTLQSELRNVINCCCKSGVKWLKRWTTCAASPLWRLIASASVSDSRSCI
jgi:hypothetical protein